MALNPKQIAAVMALPGPRRFEHFIKVVADRQQVWGLYDDGWALAGTDDGAAVFPFWPAEEYALACAANEWAAYTPRMIEVEDFMRGLLPGLEADGVLPGIFFTPASQGVTVPVDELLRALEAELEKY